MTHHRTRIRKRRVAALAAVLAAVAAIISGHQPSSSLPSPSTLAAQLTVAAGDHFHRQSDHGGLGEAGGALPSGTSVFDDGVPGVARLDPDLLSALRRAATDAGNGIRFVVNSGWRSPAYEDELRKEAVAKYGSEQEAARWVATGTTSPHVSGEAVDVGPNAADAWLAQHGAAYGLCQIYANEPWHYELRRRAADDGCPEMYADPTHDPRMQK